MSTRRAPPKHQNRYAWKPNAGRKIDETQEVGGRFRPLSEITGVCSRCKEQIEWKCRYGKYKPLTEPAKCQRCTKRNVRQAYHNLCAGCAKDNGLCAKCCCCVDNIIGRDLSEVEAEQKILDEAIKHARERERRTLLCALNKGKPNSSEKSAMPKENKVGDLFPSASLEEYAKSSRGMDLGDTGNDTETDDEVDEEEEEGDKDDEEEESEDRDDEREVEKKEAEHENKIKIDQN